MSDAAANVGITITATDKTGPAFAAATKGADLMATKFAGVGNVVKRMPEQFSKVSAALMVSGTSFGQLGGSVGAAMGKLSGLAGLIAGGPVGIAIAGVTIAVAAAAKALGDYGDAAAKAGEKSRELWEKEAEHARFLRGIRESNKAESDKERDEANDAEDKRRREAAALVKQYEEENRAATVKAAEENAAKLRTIAEAEKAYNAQQIEEQMAVERAAFEAKEKAGEEEAEIQKERAMAVGRAIENVSGHMTSILMADTDERRKAAISAALDEAQAAIVAKAASGAAKAFEGAQSLPFPANLIVGPAVAAVVGAAIMALRSQIKLAQGGLVTGGVPGKDSVPALLMPGERVLSKAQVAGGMGGGGTTIINNHYAMLDASQLDRSVRRRNARVQGRDQDELASRGMFPGRRR